MKKTILILIILIFFLQYSLFSMIGEIERINARILLCFLLVIFLRRDYLENIGWAICAGLLVDYFSNVPFGFNVINFGILAFFVDMIRRKFALKEMHFSIVALIVFFGVIFSDFLAMIFYGLLNWAKIIKETSSIDFSFSFEYFLTVIILSVIGFLFHRIILVIENVFGIGSREIKIDRL